MEQEQSSKRMPLLRLWVEFRSIMNLRDGVDVEGTIQGIESDVEFRGHGAWILLLSALIASIGLSTGSTAVIIGAMLISPLMGPILGIGLAAARNDFDLLKRALKNFGVAVIIAVVISVVYFIIVPVPEINPELADRKSATMLAIAIALFGGAAGIIAGSRPLKSNVVPGVAIATALMPPLCTVGYGIATWQWDFILGAAYLFYINSVFIALPTYLYIRYMQFPMVQFVDAARERKMKRNIALFIVVTMVPSVIIFAQVLQNSLFERDASLFVASIEEELEAGGTMLIESKVDADAEPKRIQLALMGEPVSEDLRQSWKVRALDFDLDGVEIDIREPRDYSAAIADLKANSSLSALDFSREYMAGELSRKSKEADSLRTELLRIKSMEGSTGLSKQVFALFPDAVDAGFTRVISENTSGNVDTLATLLVRWNPETTQQEIRSNEERLRGWLTVALKGETVRVVTVP
ncbi:MAG: hypothetical protein RL226_1834 [Bacteroidota bacterium]